MHKEATGPRGEGRRLAAEAGRETGTTEQSSVRPPRPALRSPVHEDAARGARASALPANLTLQPPRQADTAVLILKMWKQVRDRRTSTYKTAIKARLLPLMCVTWPIAH